MRKRRGNPDWTKPDRMNLHHGIHMTEFELEVARLGLTMASEVELVNSSELRGWINKQCDTYAPESLLQALGLKGGEFDVTFGPTPLPFRVGDGQSLSMRGLSNG